MDLIPCLRHKSSKLSMLYIGKTKSYIICEQCLSDQVIDEANPKFESLISIQKVIKEPELMFSKMKNEKLQKIGNCIINCKRQHIKEQICDLQQKMKIIISSIQNMFKDLQTCVEEVLVLNEKMLNETIKLIDYKNFTNIFSELEKSGENISEDAFNQIQIQVNQYLQNIDSKLAKGIFKSDLETQIQQSHSLLKKKLHQSNSIYLKLVNFFREKSDLVEFLLRYDKSSIVDGRYFEKLATFIQERTKRTIINSKVVYIGTRDGLNANSFWKKVNGIGNLLMIFKTESKYIFGGYSPCKWESHRNSHISDPSNTSFLFSQTHDQIYPIKANQNTYAIYCNSQDGPYFGGGSDSYIQADFKNGYSKLGHTYEWHQYQNKNTTHLYGTEKPNIVECEIYEIIFQQ